MGKKRKPPMDPRLAHLIMKLKRVKKSLEEDKELPYFKPTTLCDLCANACGFCEWSEAGNMRPVPGWEAIRNDISSGRVDGSTVALESYIVLDCPKYRPDENGARYTFDRQHVIDRYMAKKEGRYCEED